MTLRVNLTDQNGTIVKTDEFDHDTRSYDLGRFRAMATSGNIGGTGVDFGLAGPKHMILPEGYGYPQGGIRLPDGVTLTIEADGHKIAVERF